MRLLCVVAVLAIIAPAAFACSLQYDPVTLPQFYRAEGWALPSNVIDPSPKFPVYALPVSANIPEATAQILKAEIFEFPSQGFNLDGKARKMKTLLASIQGLRWVMRGRTVAYSYSLNPVIGHKRDGEWIIETSIGCIFYATFVDDRGDGVFRVLIPSTFATDLIPAWALRAEN